jgi:hypothetical protein
MKITKNVLPNLLKLYERSKNVTYFQTLTHCAFYDFITVFQTI